MNKRNKKFLSAMTAAAVCAVNVTTLAANSGILIDHDCSGIDKGYYYEYVNNDDTNKPIMLAEAGGNFEISWENDENFYSARGLKFASPVEYSKLGDIKWKYWKRIELESFSDDNGYVRFGILVRNTYGDCFAIMEADSSADGKSITEKDARYKEIGSIDSKEVFNDSNIFGPVEGATYDVPYTIYSLEAVKTGSTVLCRRDKPIDLNNDIEDSRTVSISDKLDAIADAGYDIGEITDITLFVDASHSKGKATILTGDVRIENMPEIASDDNTSLDPFIIKDYDYGVRDGYYYYYSNLFGGQTEITSPSTFKAEWDSMENSYNRDPVFERGKQFENGQSYKALAGSSVDYSMDLDIEGRFTVNTRATLVGPETDECIYQTDIYIVDAYRDFGFPCSVEKLGEIVVDGKTYDAFYYMTGMTGSFKTRRMPTYYFISRDARENGSLGKVSAKHDLAPFVEFIRENDGILGSPSSLVVQLNGGVSKGSAELVKNEITLPEFIEDEKEYAKILRKINITSKSGPKKIGDLKYKVYGEGAQMIGYADEEINCGWGLASLPDWISVSDNGHHRFVVSKDNYTNPWSSGWDVINFVNSSDSFSPTSFENVFDRNDCVLIDYSIDLSEPIIEKENSNTIIGGAFVCKNDDYRVSYSDDGVIDTNGEYHGYDVVVADKWDKSVGVEMCNDGIFYHDPVELGTIKSNGAVYDVKVLYPEYQKGVNPYVILTRRESLEFAGAEKITEKYTRYSNTIDVTDIVRKLRGLGLKLDEVEAASFELNTFGNAGSAVINSVDIKSVPREKVEYTADDMKALSDYLLGKSSEIPEGKDYDVNEDGVWNTYDLCMMRRQIASSENE